MDALAVRGSELARAATARYDFLTLDHSAVIAGFEDDTEAVKALVAAAKQGEVQFQRAAQQATGRPWSSRRAASARPACCAGSRRGCARRHLALSSASGARVLVLGGAPFEEQIVMWWNFVARSNDEIVAAREEWMGGSGFGEVAGFDGYRLPAPDLPPGRLKPAGAVR